MFPPSTAADDVLSRIDLTERHAVITAGHVGIGLELTRALAKAGPSVLIGARTSEVAADAMGDLPGVSVDRCDLVDPASIDGFVERWLPRHEPLHNFVNNAGAFAGPQRDARGFETQFAVNHLRHLQLTCALFPALQAARGASGQRLVRRAAFRAHPLGRS